MPRRFDPALPPSTGPRAPPSPRAVGDGARVLNPGRPQAER